MRDVGRHCTNLEALSMASIAQARLQVVVLPLLLRLEVQARAGAPGSCGTPSCPLSRRAGCARGCSAPAHAMQAHCRTVPLAQLPPTAKPSRAKEAHVSSMLATYAFHADAPPLHATQSCYLRCHLHSRLVHGMPSCMVLTAALKLRSAHHLRPPVGLLLHVAQDHVLDRRRQPRHLHPDTTNPIMLPSAGSNN